MLAVRRLSKRFSDKSGSVWAVQSATFEVREGECYALFGPSGCGKTTILRCIAGLERPEHGVVEIGAKTVSNASRGIFVPAHRRSIGLVFQSYAIWPHLSVFENVAYPLRVLRPRLPEREIVARVMKMLELVGMGAMKDRPAPMLSGGQQQRVALARAIVRQPRLLLMDEPLASLDVHLREEMRGEIRNLVRHSGATVVYVTHDQSEAFTVADRLAIIQAGQMIQEGIPRDVYASPCSPFVATLLGAANLVTCRVEQQSGPSDLVVSLAGGKSTLIVRGGDRPVGETVEIVMRPEDITVSGKPLSRPNVVPGRLVCVNFLGNKTECVVDIEQLSLRAFVHPSENLIEGQHVWVAITDGCCAVLPPAASRHLEKVSENALTAV